MLKFVDGGNTKHKVTNDKRRLLMFAVHWCLMFLLCKGNIQMISLVGDSFQSLAHGNIDMWQPS
jgi:hypothetical protein